MDQVEWPPEAVPCGKCAGCRRDRARQWSIRMIHEAQLHERLSAVTLTYNDEHLPPGGGLRHRDFVNFLKRLRKAGYRFRYYMCGEYGDENLRPHYHAILYGLDFPDRTLWVHTGKSKQFRSETLSHYWPHGWSLLGEVNPAAIRYVAGYLNKKLGDTDSPVSQATGELLQPYQHMSRRPAIAKRWIERHHEEVYATDTVVIDGREMRPPAYYDRWLKDNQPERWREIREKRYHEFAAKPKPSAKRYRQMCEAIQLLQAPFENRPLDNIT